MPEGVAGAANAKAGLLAHAGGQLLEALLAMAHWPSGFLSRRKSCSSSKIKGASFVHKYDLTSPCTRLGVGVKNHITRMVRAAPAAEPVRPRARARDSSSGPPAARSQLLQRQRPALAFPTRACGRPGARAPAGQRLNLNLRLPA